MAANGVQLKPPVQELMERNPRLEDLGSIDGVPYSHLDETRPP